jgi:hypothetical protein
VAAVQSIERTAEPRPASRTAAVKAAARTTAAASNETSGGGALRMVAV